MAVPTIVSTGTNLDRDFKLLNSTIQACRTLSVAWKATLAAGDTSIDDIVSGIYVPFAASPRGFWHSISDLSTGGKIKAYYAEQLSKRVEMETGTANLTTDRVNIPDGHKFVANDKVEIEGPGTPPTGLTKATNYWIFDVLANNVSFKATAGGAKISLTGQGSGLCWIDLRMGLDFTTLITACEAVIDEVITEVPVTATTLELRARKFDKALALSTNGLSPAVLTAVETANLQTALQGVIDAIEAPI